VGWQEQPGQWWCQQEALRLHRQQEQQPNQQQELRLQVLQQQELQQQEQQELQQQELLLRFVRKQPVQQPAAMRSTMIFSFTDLLDF
jgi:hypothetical protein